MTPDVNIYPYTCVHTHGIHTLRQAFAEMRTADGKFRTITHRSSPNSVASFLMEQNLKADAPTSL